MTLSKPTVIITALFFVLETLFFVTPAFGAGTCAGLLAGQEILCNASLVGDSACKALCEKDGDGLDCTYKPNSNTCVATIVKPKPKNADPETAPIPDDPKKDAATPKPAAEVPAQGTSPNSEKSNIPADLKQDIKALNQFGEGTTIPILLGRAVRIAMGLVGTIALVMFVYGGVLWMTAGGNSDRVQHAAKILVWSGLGIVVIVASVALADFLFEAFR